MNINKYESRIKHGRTIFIAGIPMLFETVNYAIPVGIFMMISGLLIIKYYNNKILYEKNREMIVKFLEDIINKIPDKKKLEKTEIIIKPKEIKVIDIFGKKYQYHNNIINNIINNNIDKIMYHDTYNDINYDKITLFLDIFMFVNKFKIIMDLKLDWTNKLLIDYYNHYYKIISYISNLNDIDEIFLAINYMEDDYYTNMKILDKLIRDILIEKNREDYLEFDNNIIKNINKVFNNIIMENLENKEKLTNSSHKCLSTREQ